MGHRWSPARQRGGLARARLAGAIRAARQIYLVARKTSKRWAKAWENHRLDPPRRAWAMRGVKMLNSVSYRLIDDEGLHITRAEQESCPAGGHGDRLCRTGTRRELQQPLLAMGKACTDRRCRRGCRAGPARAKDRSGHAAGDVTVKGRPAPHILMTNLIPMPGRQRPVKRKQGKSIYWFRLITKGEKPLFPFVTDEGRPAPLVSHAQRRAPISPLSGSRTSCSRPPACSCRTGA